MVTPSTCLGLYSPACAIYRVILSIHYTESYVHFSCQSCSYVLHAWSNDVYSGYFCVVMNTLLNDAECHYSYLVRFSFFFPFEGFPMMLSTA